MGHQRMKDRWVEFVFPKRGCIVVREKGPNQLRLVLQGN
jgi:hypothetical protein